ncbi:hypothetical protein BZA05DRAFT_404105 [Tricharina praecox]|uniref:uncharacterized protein n=1 Tax=Tricharina praecox TaxID=43433 RepID=UPI00221E61FB|nr:uncharacterized protein BZA05DRAFT_404105 [Tricharina praecox]KAI5848003.1 hypothetical protein BZA05DRAFT_404105 [Tricharina praecox]
MFMMWFLQILCCTPRFNLLILQPYLGTALVGCSSAKTLGAPLQPLESGRGREFPPPNPPVPAKISISEHCKKPSDPESNGRSYLLLYGAVDERALIQQLCVMNRRRRNGHWI